MIEKTKVTVRKGKPHQSGYLLSVEKFNKAGGSTVFPGPKCSSHRTALEVAYWIENNVGYYHETESN